MPGKTGLYRRRIAKAIKPKKKKVPNTIKKYVNRQISLGGEQRFIDYIPFNNTNITTAGIMSQLVAQPQQGDGIVSREGDDIYITGIWSTITITGSETGAIFSTDFFNNVKVMLLYTKSNAGRTLPAIVGQQGIIDTGTWDADCNWGAPRGWGLRNTYKTKFSKSCTVAGVESASVDATEASPFVRDHVKRISYFWKFPGRGQKCTFTSNAGDSTAFASFFPMVVLISDSSATPHPTVNMATRMYFTA